MSLLGQTMESIERALSLFLWWNPTGRCVGSVVNNQKEAEALSEGNKDKEIREGPPCKPLKSKQRHLLFVFMGRI
jgi:hypothetical protein